MPHNHFFDNLSFKFQSHLHLQSFLLMKNCICQIRLDSNFIHKRNFSWEMETIRKLLSCFKRLSDLKGVIPSLEMEGSKLFLDSLDGDKAIVDALVGVAVVLVLVDVGEDVVESFFVVVDLRNEAESRRG